ncbi:MAG: peptidylprolyl isomerase, partial [Ferruginibacter sp.]
MKKHFCATFIAVVALTANASAQTLFTIEKDSVSVKSFLAAYKKNNTAARNDVQGMKDYLDLYIASRLKLREARRRGLDTLPQLISDLQGLRAQILPSYLNDEGAVNNLVKEAFSRSQKDIHLAHIFISAGKGDTIAASHQVTEIYKRLQKGDAFASLARQYSNDPSARDNGGEVGFITAFTLPYALENLIYATSAGTLSPVYHSAEGYHILKNISERKAVGRMKAAQILIAFPPDATEAIKENAKRLVDSLYKLLQKGNDFGKLATQ